MLQTKGRYFSLDGRPFFWLGDTCWLLFSRMTREEMRLYFRNRALQGFNVVLATLVHTPGYADREGHRALAGDDFARPDVDSGYWDTVEYAIQLAAENGIQMGLVLCWGDFYAKNAFTPASASAYASFLSERLGSYSNLFWLLGGDVRGSVCPDIFRLLGRTLKQKDPSRLVGYHPFGRTSSSQWFAGEEWLDFHLFQSGHRDRSQRSLGAWDDNAVSDEEWMGEENYRYVFRDYERDVKPVLDGEPSYEEIPHGLHDPSRPYWTAREVRRYAWWSVLAGGAGFTYGHNSVMQVWHDIGTPNFGVRRYWDEALSAQGAGQMRFLRKAMEAVSFEEGRSAQDLLRNNTGEEDEYLVAFRSSDALLVYSYTGGTVAVADGLGFVPSSAYYLNPSTGALSCAALAQDGVYQLPKGPGLQDWVLILAGERTARKLEASL